jgi:hypothetical protein
LFFRDREKLICLRFTPNFVGLTPAPRGRLPQICKRIEQHLGRLKFKLFFVKLSFCKIVIFFILQKIDQFSPKFVGLTPAPRGRSSPICEKNPWTFYYCQSSGIFSVKMSIFLSVILIFCVTWIFLQIGSNLPLRARVNPTKFGLNRSYFSFSRKSSKYLRNNNFCDQSDD